MVVPYSHYYWVGDLSRLYTFLRFAQIQKLEKDMLAPRSGTQLLRDIGTHWGNITAILGLSWDNGK